MQEGFTEELITESSSCKVGDWKIWIRKASVRLHISLYFTRTPPIFQPSSNRRVANKSWAIIGLTHPILITDFCWFNVLINETFLVLWQQKNEVGHQRSYGERKNTSPIVQDTHPNPSVRGNFRGHHPSDNTSVFSLGIWDVDCFT